MSRNELERSRWTMPVLRIGMGLFLLAWGIDKWMATEESIGIFSHFYGVDVGDRVLGIRTEATRAR